MGGWAGGGGGEGRADSAAHETQGGSAEKKMSDPRDGCDRGDADDKVREGDGGERGDEGVDGGKLSGEYSAEDLESSEDETSQVGCVLWGGVRYRWY